jgi:hypothetical protein
VNHPAAIQDGTAVSEGPGGIAVEHDRLALRAGELRAYPKTLFLLFPCVSLSQCAIHLQARC